MEKLAKSFDGMLGLTIGYLLKKGAEIYPNRLAVVDVDNAKRCTYQELYNKVEQVARGLSDRGIKKGDKVSIIMKDRMEYVELMYALNKIGAIWVPCNYRFVANEAQFQIDHSDSIALVFEDEYMAMVEDMRSGLHKIKDNLFIAVGHSISGKYISYNSLGSEAQGTVPDVFVSDSDPCGLIYTSGTTGGPKGAVHTSRTFIGWAMIPILENCIRWEDRVLNPYPMFHMGGSVISVVCLLAGAANYILGKFDAHKFLKVIQDEKISCSIVVPTILNAVTKLPEQEIKKYDLSSLVSLATSGAPFMSETQKIVTAYWPHINLYSWYSATEAFFSMLLPYDHDRKVRCVGSSAFGMEVKILKETGDEAPRGEIGLIYGRGISVFDGYYKNTEANQRSFQNDWFTCEDIGYCDQEGYLYVVDRKKDMILSGGENISSVEIENTLLKHPHISEVAVVGIPDDLWGERVHAVVTVQSGHTVTSEEIIEWCKGKIAGYKRPRSVEVVHELPKSPVGKILKRVIRDQYWKGRGLDI